MQLWATLSTTPAHALAAARHGPVKCAIPTPMLPMQLTTFFAGHGPVKCVRQRRYLVAHSKAFKGSCFVEFATVEDMEKVLHGGHCHQGPLGHTSSAARSHIPHWLRCAF